MEDFVHTLNCLILTVQRFPTGYERIKNYFKSSYNYANPASSVLLLYIKHKVITSLHKQKLCPQEMVE